MTFLCEIKLTPDSAPQAGPKDTPVKSNTNVLVRGALTYLSCSRRDALCGGSHGTGSLVSVKMTGLQDGEGPGWAQAEQ